MFYETESKNPIFENSGWMYPMKARGFEARWTYIMTKLTMLCRIPHSSSLSLFYVLGTSLWLRPYTWHMC